MMGLIPIYLILNTVEKTVFRLFERLHYYIFEVQVSMYFYFLYPLKPTLHNL